MNHSDQMHEVHRAPPVWLMTVVMAVALPIIPLVVLAIGLVMRELN